MCHIKQIISIELCIFVIKFQQVRKILPGSKSVVILTLSMRAFSCYVSKSF